jgi:monovalent cation:H+ antiporter-2, CPA2 family
MMGVLIAEDIIVVLLLSVLTSVFTVGSLTFPGFVWDIGKIILFIIGTVLIGILIIPKLIDKVAHPDKEVHVEHDEVLLLFSLGLCFGFAILSNLVGLSFAIGAFLIGIFIASSKSSEKVAALTSPIKDMFAAIFFVSMGAFINMAEFRIFLIPALIVTVLMMVGKIVGCGLGTKLFKYDTFTALKVGLGMGQIGEFAFIVIKVGQDLNVISPFLFPTVGVAVALTAFLTPYMIKLSYSLKPVKLE